MTIAVDHDYRLLIGGEWVPAAGGYEVTNPATEELVGTAPNASPDQAADACAAARAAQKAWAATPMAERCALLGKVADIIEGRLDDLVPLTQAETGATLRVAKTLQVPQAAARFRYYSEPIDTQVPLPPAIMPSTPLAPGGIVGAVEHRAPAGVVACLAAYNFPITNMAGKLAPALAMGNAVVVKPPVQDPLGTVVLCEAFEEAGFPPGVVNLVVGDTVEVAEAITTSPDVDMISFTGSTAVGCRIAEVAGAQMKRLLLELGGKGAAIVFDDADVKTVLANVSSTWTFHSGQICTSPTRLVVQRGRLRRGWCPSWPRCRACSRSATRSRRTRSSARSSPGPTASGSRATSPPRSARGPRRSPAGSDRTWTGASTWAPPSWPMPPTR